MNVTSMQAFPVPSEKHEPLQDSYWRELIPGTSTRYARGYHYGIDVPAPQGAAVVAPWAGKVIAVGNVWGTAYGDNQVLILHTAHLGLWRWWSFYAHMLDRHVYVGEVVRVGAHIGDVGKQGNATGYHLHNELHVGPGWTQVADPRPIATGSTLYHLLVHAQSL